MATQTSGTKRPLSEVEEGIDAAAEAKIAQQIADGRLKTESRPKSKKPRVEERRSIFVRSLPPDATNETLTDFFSEYFPVKHATVVVDQATKQSRGYGFVTFADAEDAQQAKVALDKKVWEGRHLRIDIAEPRTRGGKGEEPQAPKPKPGRPDAPQATKLIVRNLPWTIKTKEQLEKLFLSFGKVRYADLPQNKGKLKGFGFVTLRGRRNAEKALETLNGKDIDGRPIAVDWAVDKKTWTEEQEKSTKTAVDDNDDDTSSSGSSDEEDDDNVAEDSAPAKSKEKELDDDMKNFLKNHMVNMEDEEDEDDEDEEAAEAAEAENDEIGAKPQRTTDNASTLFIRNLPFTATDDQVKEFFNHFGAVRYARVVYDKATDKPAGTGFVCFFNEEDAKSCVKNAPRPQQSVAAAKSKHSILQDENADPDGQYTLDGRLLQVAQAVNREQAANLADSSLAQRHLKDKRRLYLLQEGAITPRSGLFKLLSQQELQMREASAGQRKKLVQKNPSLHLSLTRLALRNIPRNIDSKDLKELARKAIVGFAKEVKEGKRQPLSKEENARDGKDAKEKEHERRAKGKGIVRQAKIIFESNQGSKVEEKSGAGKSRGYGFIEYTNHHWALMGLRYLNGMQLEGENGRKQRLIVEFAIENAQVVQRRKAVEASGAQGAQRAKDKESSTKASTEDDDKKTAKILKDNKSARGNRGKGKKGNMNKGAKAKKPEDGADHGSEKAAPAEGTSDMKQKLIARTRLMRKKKAKARAG
ncbi:nucleolar protein 4 [Emericellopsis cladophorae]|uniref:Nucleolar protein 4 n=1 Tax=Emericellopsis cladophorae TaxID=2686198 RepID=A0A9Q0BBZ1_9HYPO|nr:nucleolar protein 4 [Emericellopsis cladophorae]KAI6779181.1 nucleolar protein 4 [Emericellopsis cladophorae]